MKLRLLACGLVIGVASVVLSTQVLSQDSGGMQPPSPEEMQAIMKAWKDTMTPGEHHKKLNHFVGSWTTTTKIWWGGPGTPATQTKGSAEVNWVLDGRYIMRQSTGEFMIPDETGAMKPVPVSHLGLTGYDNYRKMYVAYWADSMGTALLTMKGGVDPSGTVFTSYGEMDEPMLGVVGRMVKYVTRIIDDDTHVFEIFDLHAADDYKVIEITYERKK